MFGLRTLICITTTAALACSSGGIETGPKPLRNEDIKVWRETPDDGLHSTVLWARNDGEQPVILTSLELYNCQELHGRCGTTEPNLRIDPDQRVRVAQFESSGLGRPANFGYRYRWRQVATVSSTPISVGPQATTLTTSPVRSVRSRAVAVVTVPLEEFVPLLLTENKDSFCESPMAPRVGSGAQPMYRMFFGDRIMSDTRMVTVMVDSAGKPTQTQDSRGDMRVTPPGVELQTSVQDPGSRMTVTTFFLDSMAVVLSQPLDGPATRILITDGDILNAPNLGFPARLAEQVLRRCGPK